MIYFFHILNFLFIVKSKSSSKYIKKENNRKINSKEKLNQNKNMINTELERQEILKQIENFENIDFEIYQKLVFFDERYFIEANSFKNPNKIHLSDCLKEEDHFYTPIAYEKMGISLLISVLDNEKLNPFSRIGNSNYKNLENLRLSLANSIFNSEEKYKSSAYCQNYMKNLNSVKKFESLNEKIYKKISENDKALKKSNSQNVRKISNPFNNNIVINNFSNNYFDILNNENFSESNNQNNINNNNDANKITYNINLGKSYMNNININNYNFNVCNFSNSDNLCKKFNL